jgi:superfamily II helicase
MLGLQVVPFGLSITAMPTTAKSFLMASNLAYSFCILAVAHSSIFCKSSSSVTFARLRAFSLSCCKTYSMTLITYYKKYKVFGTTICMSCVTRRIFRETMTQTYSSIVTIKHLLKIKQEITSTLDEISVKCTKIKTFLIVT